MRPNKVKTQWRSGKPVTNGWLASGDPYVAEAMANAGYDAVVIDMQHGMGITVDRAIACLQAISTTDTMPMCRVSWNDPKEIQQVLDAGAYGIIVPMVNTAEEAAKAAGATRYPPIGYRSSGTNRVRFYAGSDYAQHANQEVLLLVMIETTEAISNLEKIAKVPGIDGFYIGPGDLALSLGITPGPNATSDPRHRAACQRVLDVAKANRLVPCHHGGNPEQAARLFGEGFMMCSIANDVGMVSAGAAASLKALGDARAKAR